MESIELVEWIFIAFAAMVLILLNGLGKVMLQIRNDISEIRSQLGYGYGGNQSFVMDIQEEVRDIRAVLDNLE